MPQTVGLHARIMDTESGKPVDEGIPDLIGAGGTVDFHSDDDILILASGQQLVIMRWQSGDISTKTVDGVGETGRWWFSSTESEIIAGRSNFECQAISIDRQTAEITVIPNAPKGCVGGGITAGVLMFAGTESVGDTRPEMLVRWSARRGDPSSSGTEDGPFGFEDWTPSDRNASGEFRLENGSRIIAAGDTIFGFIVWTDTAAFEITGRTDVFIFAEAQISSRGILAPRAWGVADDRVWWYDHTRTLNVYDGGRPRQIPCPLRNSELERVPDDDLERVSMSVDLENSEISLHYPDDDGHMRELVYNYREQAWYVFALDRVNMTSANGPRPSVGMTGSGQLMFYDVREVLSEFREASAAPAPAPGSGRFRPRDTPERFSFHIETNWLATESPAVQSFRARNVVLPHTFARGPSAHDEDDMIMLSVRGYGRLDLKEFPYVDTQLNSVGNMVYFLRVGGKAIQYVISGTDIRTFLRFRGIDFEADEGGKR
jgi:hypothetical protein